MKVDNKAIRDWLQQLFLLFIGLKLAGFIKWSWWWVASPCWVPAVIAVAVYIIIFTYNLIKQ